MSDEQGRDNRLMIYLSTERTLYDTLSAIAFDKDGLEMGRTQLVLEAAANTGDHYELTFQEGTDLECQSRVEVR